MILRKLSSQGPGFGKRLRIAGTKAISRKGRARPTPRPAKITKAATGGNTIVAPRAAAMNGPVQGVATKAASAPVQKDPAVPSFLVSLLPKLRLGSSNRPARLRPMAVTSASRTKMIRGSCN